ncbi:PREDICTED: uncharacterized protein LOC105574546, partial [Cercocebus atys]|uniref:uncharacterized protein LOC105574546 n=1 Tax=Cercocebus atys TaxID=9531 RepID=UPI0005F39869
NSVRAGLRLGCGAASPGPRLCFQPPGQPFATTPGIRRTSCRPRPVSWCGFFSQRGALKRSKPLVGWGPPALLQEDELPAAFVRGCSVLVFINEKRPHRMGMRFPLLRESRISSRGRGLHKLKVEPPPKRLTSGHMTQEDELPAAFVRGCSVFVLINEKRPHRMEMRFQLLWESRISSRGRGLHKPKCDGSPPARSRLAHAHWLGRPALRCGQSGCVPEDELPAAFVRGCSVFVLINEKRPHRIGMRFQLLRESRISSRGRGLHKPKAEPLRKRLTSGHMTQAGRGRRLTKDSLMCIWSLSFQLGPNDHLGPRNSNKEIYNQKMNSSVHQQLGRYQSQDNELPAAFVGGCSVFVLINEKRPQGMGMRCQLLRGPRVSSPDRDLHIPRWNRGENG